MSLPRPEVFPLSDGGLMFRWQTDAGTAEMEIDCEGDAIVLIDLNGEDRYAYPFGDSQYTTASGDPLLMFLKGTG